MEKPERGRSYSRKTKAITLKIGTLDKKTNSLREDQSITNSVKANEKGSSTFLVNLFFA